MRKLTSTLCCLILFAIGGQTSWAQDFVSFQIEAKIIEVHGDNQDVLDDVKIGDLLNGILTYDPDLSMLRVTAANLYMYDLGASPASRLTFSTGEHSFSSVAFDEDGEVGIGIFTANLFSMIDNSQQPANCQHSFNIRSESFGNGLPDPLPISQIEMQLSNFDCDFRHVRNELPNTIDLDDWETAEVLISASYPDKGTVSLRARITSLKSGTLEGVQVKGSVFADYDQDCIRNNDDITLPRRYVRFNPTRFITATNEFGEYSANLPLGEYQVEVVEAPLWSMSCPAEALELNLQTGDESVTADFALEADELVEAVDVSVMSGGARPGFEITYNIRIHNSGTLPYSGTVRFTHDELLTDFDSNPAADNYTDPVAEWLIEDLPVGGLRHIAISMMIPADEKLLGTFICASVESELEEKGHDEILRESSDEICQEIRGSYDPNDIQVFVGKRNADGAITADDKILTYLIRFQNEGNEDAINVRVLDELSQHHDIAKVRIGASSHEGTVNFTDENVLEWTFNNINLAPKERDEAASQGYVKFEVHLRGELSVGTEIPNSAAIYFDFNSPVITNTVVSRIASSTTSVADDLLAESVRVYPNPSSDVLTVSFDTPVPATLSLRNSLGVNVFTQNVNSHKYVLDLRAFAAGSYFLSIQTAAGKTTKPLNIVR